MLNPLKRKHTMSVGTSTNSHYLKRVAASFGLFLSYTLVVITAASFAGMLFYFLIFQPYIVELEAMNKSNQMIIGQIAKDIKEQDEKLNQLVPSKEGKPTNRVKSVQPVQPAGAKVKASNR